MTTYTDRLAADVADAMRADLAAAGRPIHAGASPAAVAALYGAAFPSATCRRCGRTVHYVRGTWTDPQATGDDSLWRETCEENHDDRRGAHEPT